MLLKGLLIFPPILCLLASYAAAGPTYLLSTPLDIRPGSNFIIGIDILDDCPPLVKVEAEIQKDNITVLEGEGIFQRGVVGTLVLPKLPLNSFYGTYELHVRGFYEDKQIFFNTTKLDFRSKSYSVFIETNSNFYKPGQEVKIQILVFSPDLKPYMSTIDIHIMDPRGNLLEQWMEEEAELGVALKSFQLSDNPPLGDWSIKVKLQNQPYYQTFTVTQYVLPKFEVLLSTPSYQSIKSGSLEGTVTAKYTYGMSVKGKLNITLSYSTISHKRNVTKTFEINGNSKFSFSNTELRNFLRYGETSSDARTSTFAGPLDVIAKVTEELTGISQNQTSSIYVIDKDYYSEFYNYPTVLKPMLNFTTYLKIKRYDGRNLTADDRMNDVSVTITQSKMFFTEGTFTKMSPEEEGNIEIQQVITYNLPENGILHIEVPINADTVHFKIKAVFLDSVNSIDVDDLFNSPNKVYLQAQNEYHDVKVGIPFNLDVQSNIHLDEIKYLVISRGQIVHVGKENAMSLTLNPQSSWTPEACLVVYTTLGDGTVVNDVTTLSVHPNFENKIFVSWNKEKASPSDSVSLKINVTESNSLVGLSVVDKSVKLLGDRQEITTKRISEDLRDYSTIHPRRITNPHQVFERCNIGVLTDAILETEDAYDVLVKENYVSEDFLPTWHSEFGGPRVRSYFPEAWIWKNINMGSDTELEISTVLPDTITTWITNAFVISENLGFGILESPVQLESFQPFFVSLNLPSYVTRGEQFVLEAVVFNYLEEDTEVSVTLEQSDAYEINIEFINATGSQQTVSVPSREGKMIFFPIRPIQLGEIPITVKAISSLASDAVIQRLLVKAEGIEHSYSQTLLLELMNNKPQNVSKALNFTFPPDVVSGSEKAFITVVGDVLGPSASSLQSLIQLPCGCGEQNMIRFAPIIFIMEYITNTRQTNDHAPKLISYMKEGYQRELVYQREDGSFSAFGNDDPSGSTWLSAFVLRCFLKARQFILVDPVVLHDTLTWLLKHQKKNGEFWEPGRVINTQLQGGQYSPVTLTAYIMAALIEYPGLLNSTQMTAAASYMESQLYEVISDNYTLSLVTYALSLVGRNKAKEGLDILNNRAESEGDLRFWKSDIQTASGWWQPSSKDIEIASYILMSHVIQNRVSEGIAVMNWLSQQRNSLGGFSSTQDTIVALQAMSLFASRHSVSKPDLFISVEGDQMASTSFSVNSGNRMLLQTKPITAGKNIKLTINAKGIGFALLQLHVIYNTHLVSSRTRRSTDIKDPFSLGIIVHDDKENINTVTLNVCTSYLETETSAQTGMAVMQVDLLSGFKLASEGVSLRYPIKKIEETMDGKVNIYFDNINKTEVCVGIPATRNSKVGYTQDAFVSVIDYYEPGRRTVKSYNSEVMQNLSPCTFCKDDCKSCKNNSHSFHLSTATFLSTLILMLYFLLL
ncbi:CD109 antigen [Rana temporaria]|uniref:CD109 antigen n=1 Tax=Rana temporaria TaxID=8407 RepID=UPI001AADD058|nr:CD109 antigen [Rana temporaria]